MKYLILSACLLCIFSCSKETVSESQSSLPNNVVETRAGEWKYTTTYQGIGKDCVAPPKDCGAFYVYSPASLTAQLGLDLDLSESGVQSFFLSSNANILFPDLNGPTLDKLQSGNYKFHKLTNLYGDDFYFAGQGSVSDVNFEFVLKLDK